jgi:hypothetical protein
MLEFLFGRKKTCKKTRPRKVRKCRRARKYNVPGSTCNKRPRKDCKSDKSCSWTTYSGCSMRKGRKPRTRADNANLTQEIIARALAAAREVAARGGSAEEQAEAAAAMAADACAQAGIPFETTQAIAALVAREVAKMGGGNVARAVEVANENVEQAQSSWNIWGRTMDFLRNIGTTTGLIEPPSAFSFGRHRRMGFGYSGCAAQNSNSQIVRDVLGNPENTSNKGMGFGKKRRTSRKTRKSRKIPAKLMKLCRKYKIKTTKKVGKRRVPKSMTLIKRQLKSKMKR